MMPILSKLGTVAFVADGLVVQIRDATEQGLGRVEVPPLVWKASVHRKAPGIPTRPGARPQSGTTETPNLTRPRVQFELPGDDVVIAAQVQEMGMIFYRQSDQIHIKPVVYGADGDIGCSPHWAQSRRIPHVTAGCFDPRIIQSGIESSRYFACAPEKRE